MQKTIITPKSTSFPNKMKELWEYRGLLYSLTWKDLRVKYAQTFIGLLWALLNPLVTLAILVFVFGIVAKVDTQGIPPVLFMITGLAGWTFFSSLLSEAGDSVINNQSMIQKIFFPRLVLPLSKVLTSLIDLGINIVLIIIVLVIFQYKPSAQIIYLPIFILLAILSGLAGGIWVSALTVKYRDFRFITQFLVRIGLYITPVAYSSDSVPESFRWIFNLNPLVGVVEGFRWCLLGVAPYTEGMIWSTGIIVILFVTGILYFVSVEKKMADII